MVQHTRYFPDDASQSSNAQYGVYANKSICQVGIVGFTTITTTALRRAINTDNTRFTYSRNHVQDKVFSEILLYNNRSQLSVKGDAVKGDERFLGVLGENKSRSRVVCYAPCETIRPYSMPSQRYCVKCMIL